MAQGETVVHTSHTSSAEEDHVEHSAVEGKAYIQLLIVYDAPVFVCRSDRHS